jgi:polygalacturonase
MLNKILQNIVFKGGYCSGGHGLSIGSVGGRSDNTVSGVSFTTSTVTKSVNGNAQPTLMGYGNDPSITY